VTTAPPLALKVENLSCTIGKYMPIADVNFHLKEGEFLALLGPTGCGKSTLLNSLAGLTKPAKGKITLFGQTQNGIHPRVGYMQQSDTALMPWRSALKNIAAGLVFCKNNLQLDKATIASHSQMWLTRVGLAGLGNHYPYQLSGGQRKRVLLAQTLIRSPALVLMDEPFGALDVLTRAQMQSELLTQWDSEPFSVLFVTHDIDEAMTLADHIIVLSAAPYSRPIAHFKTDFPRPRSINTVRYTSQYIQLHADISSALRSSHIPPLR